MRLGKTGRQIALSFEPWQYIETIAVLVHFVLGWFAMSAVVFLRKDFGERYLSWINLFFGYMAAGLFTGIGGWLLSAWAHESASGLMPLLLMGFFAMSGYHRWQIRKKNKLGIRWFSMYSGTPLLMKFADHQLLGKYGPVSEEAINKWIEPGLLLVLAFVMKTFHSTPVAAWLFISAMALFLHEQISYMMQRTRVLDMIDAEIEAKHWQGAVTGKPPKETSGFTIARSNVELLKESEAAQDVFASLSPDLKAIMDQPAEVAEEELVSR